MYVTKDFVIPARLYTKEFVKARKK